MSNDHLKLVWAVRTPEVDLDVGTRVARVKAHHMKAVLVNLADRACEHCGACWPGVSTIGADVELGTTSVRQALAVLVRMGLAEEISYPRGGRGRATVYRVMGSLMELSKAAPCAECQARMRQASDGHREATDTQHPYGGIRPVVVHKPDARVLALPLGAGADAQRTGVGFSPKPTADSPETQRTGVDQPSVEPEPSRAHTREPQAERPAAASSGTPPLSTPAVGALLRTIMPGFEPSTSLDAIPSDHSSAATPAHRATPQEPGLEQFAPAPRWPRRGTTRRRPRSRTRAP